MRTHWKIIALIVGIAIIAFFGGYKVGDMVDTDLQKDDLPDLYLPIYKIDPNTYKEEIRYYVRIPGHLPLKGKLDSLAGQVSRHSFGGRPIEVKAIEKKDGRSIAIIDLQEKSAGRKDWYMSFQGSCGGMVTSMTLIHTFLQRDFEGEWVDGVWFYYEGSPLSEYDGRDHIPYLCRITLRDSI